VKKAKAAGPFPYLGQGEAGYFEHFEMWVWFEGKVAPKDRAAVLDGAPPPAAQDAAWPSPEVLHLAGSDIQRAIVDAYGTPAAKAKMAAATKRKRRGDDGDDVLDDLIAGKEVATFEAALESWLRAAHAKQPILFAVRAPDAEAGGTRLGKWHAESVDAFGDRVVPALRALAKTKLGKADRRRFAITAALNLVGPAKVDAALHALAIPGRLRDEDVERDRKTLDGLSRAVVGKDYAAALALARGVPEALALPALASIATHAYSFGVDLEPAAAHRLLLALADAALHEPLSKAMARAAGASDGSPGRISVHMLCEAYVLTAAAAAWAKDAKTFARLVKSIDAKPEPLTGYLRGAARKLEAKRPEEARALAKLAPAPSANDLLMEASRTSDPAKALLLYDESCEMKSTWETVVGGLRALVRVHPKAVPKDLAERWLARARRQKNPDVSRRMAVLLARLGRTDEAVAEIAKALRLGEPRELLRDHAELKPLLRHPDVVAAARGK